VTGKNDRLVLTIGHSTRTIDSFIDLLKMNGVTMVIDIRTVPRSRHNPQFNKDVLPGELVKTGIGYLHIPGLGGLRRPVPDSLNVGWRNASFRGFADYMQTAEFQEAIKTLINLARIEQIALMCAEVVPWRCHRSLIADALLVRGLLVEHILGIGERRQHVLTQWAEVHGTVITYPSSAVRSLF
jgi:uncharacterized protein (DUF488 family)